MKRQFRKVPVMASYESHTCEFNSHYYTVIDYGKCTGGNHLFYVDGYGYFYGKVPTTYLYGFANWAINVDSIIDNGTSTIEERRSSDKLLSLLNARFDAAIEDPRSAALFDQLHIDPIRTPWTVYANEINIDYRCIYSREENCFYPGVSTLIKLLKSGVDYSNLYVPKFVLDLAREESKNQITHINKGRQSKLFDICKTCARDITCDEEECSTDYMIDTLFDVIRQKYPDEILNSKEQDIICDWVVNGKLDRYFNFL